MGLVALVLNTRAKEDRRVRGKGCGIIRGKGGRTARALVAIAAPFNTVRVGRDDCLVWDGSTLGEVIIARQGQIASFAFQYSVFIEEMEH